MCTSVRAAGNALALMLIMTVGLAAAIPPRFTSSGSAFNNIAQRVSSSSSTRSTSSCSSRCWLSPPATPS